MSEFFSNDLVKMRAQNKTLDFKKQLKLISCEFLLNFLISFTI